MSRSPTVTLPVVDVSRAQMISTLKPSSSLNVPDSIA